MASAAIEQVAWADGLGGDTPAFEAVLLPVTVELLPLPTSVAMLV